MDGKLSRIHSDATTVKGSLSEYWTFQELERFVCFVAEEPLASSKTKTLTDILVENKKNYIERMHSNITGTKNSFLELFRQMNGCIDDMTREIVVRAYNRREELKAQLSELGKEKIAKWNQQLSLCEDFLKKLNTYRSPCYLGDSSFVDTFFESYVNRELECVDSGDINLCTESYPGLLKRIENLGSINCTVSKIRNVVPKFIFGCAGQDYSQFCRPWGVCSDDTGRILVCDRCNHRIQVFSESGQFLIQFGKEGSKPGEFNRPTGIAVDKKCRVIVADKDNHRIQVFTYSGNYLYSFGKQGTKPSEFMYPWDVAVNKDNDIAVSDSKNHRVQLFTEHGVLRKVFDASVLRIWGLRAGLRFLDSPRGLAFKPDGSLLVTDFNNHRVLLINKQFNGASFYGKEGHSLGEFFRPQGITCDKTGRFAVSDCKNYRIQLFGQDGEVQRCFGSQGNAPGQFDCPQGISFHPNLNLIVVDLNNNRVQVF